MYIITFSPLFLDPCELQLQQDNPGNTTTTSLIFPLTENMSSYQSVPKPWSSASSTGRTWAPIRAPISRSSNAGTTPITTTSDAPLEPKSPSMSALPSAQVARVPNRQESSTHESSDGPPIVQQQDQEEPYYNQHHKNSNNNHQLKTSLLGELDSILGK